MPRMRVGGRTVKLPYKNRGSVPRRRRYARGGPVRRPIRRR